MASKMRRALRLIEPARIGQTPSVIDANEIVLRCVDFEPVRHRVARTVDIGSIQLITRIDPEQIFLVIFDDDLRGCWSVARLELDLRVA